MIAQMLQPIIRRHPHQTHGPTEHSMNMENVTFGMILYHDERGSRMPHLLHKPLNVPVDIVDRHEAVVIAHRVGVRPGEVRRAAVMKGQRQPFNPRIPQGRHDDPPFVRA